MSQSYYVNSLAGWRWISILYRLSTSTQAELKITPSTSIHTARAKLFGGRQWVCASVKPDVTKYLAASYQTSIKADRFQLVITTTEAFHQAWGDIVPDDFILCLKKLTSSKLSGPSTFIPQLRLAEVQCVILDEYLKPLFKKVLITPSMVTVVPK